MKDSLNDPRQPHESGGSVKNAKQWQLGLWQRFRLVFKKRFMHVDIDERRFLVYKKLGPIFVMLVDEPLSGGDERNRQYFRNTGWPWEFLS